jgi:3-methyladenine DNA glycosylase AlkD
MIGLNPHGRRIRMTSSYAKSLELRLRAHANPESARPMQAYMRDLFPYLGIRSPECTALIKAFVQEQTAPEGEALTEAVRELWQLPEREFQYAAIHLLEKQKKGLQAEDIKLFEDLVTSKSWWDTVDTLASRLIGGQLFIRYPELIAAYTERWIQSDNLWLQRTALLFQLSYKNRTDAARLFDYIRRTSASREFFLRKAIGWALREYSKTDEAAVRSFLDETELSPLSRREALKYVSQKKLACRPEGIR